MAAINLNNATRTLTSGAFLKSAVLVVIGSLFASIVADQMSARVYNIPVAGADGIYALVAAALALTFLPGQFGRPIALGSTAAAIQVVAAEYGVI